MDEMMMTQDNGSRGTGILLAAAAGALVGAGVALLFAPCSGVETREWLSRRSSDLKAGTSSAIQRGKEAIRRTANEIGSDIADARARMSTDSMRG